MSSNVLVVMSGGLDSTTLAYDLEAKGWKVGAVSFDYGQRHRKELIFAREHAMARGWEYDQVDMSALQESLVSALTGNQPIPEGHYAADTMKATIVPNRNAIMMSLACGIAVSRDIHYIATAVHGGDHFIYPDCRPGFINLLSGAFHEGNEGFKGILAPYVDHDKNYIAQRAVDLGYDYNRTWSCYVGGQKHCGKCGTCVERMEALWSCTLPGKETPAEDNHVPLSDRLEFVFPSELYADNTYWMKALEEAKKPEDEPTWTHPSYDPGMDQ